MKQKLSRSSSGASTSSFIDPTKHLLQVGISVSLSFPFTPSIFNHSLFTMTTQEETSSTRSPVLPTRNNDDDEERLASDHIPTQTTSPSSSVVDDDDMTEINIDGVGTISGMQNSSHFERIIDNIGRIWTPVSLCFPSSISNFHFLSYVQTCTQTLVFVTALTTDFLLFCAHF